MLRTTKQKEMNYNHIDNPGDLQAPPTMPPMFSMGEDLAAHNSWTKAAGIPDLLAFDIVSALETSQVYVDKLAMDFEQEMLRLHHVLSVADCPVTLSPTCMALACY